MSTVVIRRETPTLIMNESKTSNHLATVVRSVGADKIISTREPNQSDIEASKSLEKTLHSYDYFESDEELAHRIDVLQRLNLLAQEWIRNVCTAKNLPLEIVKTAGGHIRTFGSYRLGVHSKGGDIDALLIAPRHVDRAEFFTSFVELLRKQPEVRDLVAVEQAFAPVIKFEFDGIEIDMLFARLASATIPENLDLKEDKILQNLDCRCAVSLNGCRVTDEILNLVPKHETFKSTLRAIKLWAKKNGLYSNALGFFGGVTWALLVAFICQLYPNAAPATLVHRFFRTFSDWNWPVPVLIKSCHNGGRDSSVWNPLMNPTDRQHLMPIITPAYPQKNSTHNVTQSTKKIIVQEIKRGLDIVNKIMNSQADWKQLFQGIPIFQRYKHFIILFLTAPTKNQSLQWSCLIGAKIRLLIKELEKNPYIELVHANPDKYTPDENVVKRLKQKIRESSMDHTDTSQTNNHKGTECASIWMFGLQFKNVSNVNIDLSKEIETFKGLVYEAAGISNMNQEEIYLDASYFHRKSLSTVLPSHFLSTVNNSSEPQRIASSDNLLSSSTSPPASWSQSSSQSSDFGTNLDSDNELPAKRQKLDDTNVNSS